MYIYRCIFMTQLTSRWPVLGKLLGNLQQTLMGCVALPLILVAAVFIRVAFEQVNTFQETLLKSDLELIARAISGPVTEALLNGERENLEATLASVFSIGRVYGASVFDSDGRRMAAAGITERDLTHSRIPLQLADSGEKREEYREVGGRRVFSHFMPLFDESDRTHGFIQITRRQTDFTSALSRLTWLAWSLWALLAALIIGTVLTGHYRGIGRHLKLLRQGMARVAADSPGYRFKIRGPREVQSISVGLNTMLDGIQRRERELEQRRMAEQALQLQLRDSETLATVGRITRGFAHELGAPLSVIEGRARRLGRHLGADDRDLAAIRHQVRQLTETVHDLLNYSRPAEPQVEPIDTDSLVRDAVDTIAEELSSKAVVVQYQPCGQTLQALRGDRRRLQLALLNIIRNAAQVARYRVLVTASGCQGGVSIDINDDGPGFPGNREQLMEPFYTTRASGEGTGLGLAISASILDEYGGTIRLGDSAAGGGKVSLWLPSDPAPERSV